MKETRALLAEYVADGSEDAFRELVGRYLGLVYSTAVRLVGGDQHLAEDVAQIVFLDLARKAGSIGGEAMLGGWLYRRTCNVARPMMRAQHRRREREQEAVRMNRLERDPNASPDDSQPTLVLDEALMRLKEEDRAIVLMRFFEGRDFRSIGALQGRTEDAVRIRLGRALYKLQRLLKPQGVTASASSLAAILASEASASIPEMLGSSIVATALSGKAAIGGFSGTCLHLMATTKAKVGVSVIILILTVGVAVPWARHERAAARLEAEVVALRRDNQRLAAELAARQEVALSQAARKDDASRDSRLRALQNEVLRLRGRVGALTKDSEELRRFISGAPNALPSWVPDGLTNAGRASPLGALQTFLWAATRHDQQEMLRAVIADPLDPAMDAETVRIVAGQERDSLRRAAKIQVLSQSEISPGLVETQYVAENKTAGGDLRRMTFVQERGEWRAIVFADRKPDGTPWHFGFERVREPLISDETPTAASESGGSE